MRRCQAVHIISAPIKGAFNFSFRENPAIETYAFPDGVRFFEMRRAYYKIPTIHEYAYGLGKADNRAITFSIVSSSIDAANSGDYNENTLVVDGKLTALPPVKITCPFGITGKWIIQDTESMIDLSFTPSTSHSRTHSLFVLSTRYIVLFGTYNGVLLDQNGVQIVLKDFPGIAKKHVLRL
jgi:hypothetical protein